MRVLVYSDLQATDGSERMCSDPTQSLQQYRVSRFMEVASSIYRDRGCEGLWDLGDTLDDRNTIPIPVLDTIISGISRFSRCEYNLKLIGNHDQFIRNTKIHSGKLFESTFRIFAEPKVIRIGDVAVFLCPYPKSNASLTEWIQDALRHHRDGRKVLLGHFDIVGARMEGGTAVTGIDRDLLSSFDLALLGHIHLAQSISDSVHYVGSPFQQNFGERDQPKRVGILDLEDLSVEWVDVGGFPAYHRIGLADFVRLVREDSEDRFQVILRTTEETEAFFAHPMCTRAEPLYEYEHAGESGGTDVISPILSSSTREVLRHYSGVVEPPSVSMSNDELVDLGMALATGN